MKGQLRPVLSAALVAATLGACETTRDVLVVAVGDEDDSADDDDGGDAGVDGPAPPQDAATAPDAPLLPPADGGLVFLIRPARALHKISPYIYGLEHRASGGTVQALDRPGSVRQGNHWVSTYNWELNVANGGVGECFDNRERFATGRGPGDTMLGIIDTAAAFKAAAIVTIPISDHVAADGNGGTPAPDCSGDVAKSGADYLTRRFKRNLPSSGRTPIAMTPVTTDGFVYQDEFVTFIRNAVKTTPVLFALDFTPDSWWLFHERIHPQKLGYDELVKRNVDFASAVKAAWPGAPIIGFGVDGYWGFTSLQGSPDAGRGLAVAYYLDKMKQAEATAGVPLIDYLDVHWVPTFPPGDPDEPAVLEARLQAPRSLWDPTYLEKSWITDELKEPFTFIPRLKQIVLAHYPGLKLAVTRWQCGGGGHVSSALCTIDTLGVFGRENVGVATLAFFSTTPFGIAGLRLFTNYDGAGGRFGETAIEAFTNDVAATSVYASLEGLTQRRLLVVAVNKRSAVSPVEIRVEGELADPQVAVWRVTSAAAAPVKADNLTATLGAQSGAVFVDRMPALSAALYVLTRR